MRKVVGLDFSLKKIAVCVPDRDGQLVWQGPTPSGSDVSLLFQPNRKALWLGGFCL
jgi:hypothetical protein